MLTFCFHTMNILSNKNKHSVLDFMKQKYCRHLVLRFTERFQTKVKCKSLKWFQNYQRMIPE